MVGMIDTQVKITDIVSQILFVWSSVSKIISRNHRNAFSALAFSHEMLSIRSYFKDTFHSGQWVSNQDMVMKTTQKTH